MIFKFEQQRLKQIDRPDLAKKVRWISQEEGDGAGYDILSFDRKGSERFLEVKTTVGSQTAPFYLTRNELSFSKERPQEFRICRSVRLLKNPEDVRAGSAVWTNSFTLSRSHLKRPSSRRATSTPSPSPASPHPARSTPRTCRKSGSGCARRDCRRRRAAALAPRTARASSPSPADCSAPSARRRI